MSNETNIEELERLAKAAAPGPWRRQDFRSSGEKNGIDDSDGDVVCASYDRLRPTSFDFIAAANPSAVLSLIDRVKKAEAERDALAAKLAELEGQEPVAVVCDTYELRWIGRGPIAQIISKHQIKAGAPLYARPVPAEEGIVTVTTNDAGRCVMVSRQDEDHRILSVIWEAKDVPTDPVNAHLLTALIQCRDRFAFYVGHHLDKGDLEKAAENEKFVAIANDAISAAESAPKAVRLTGEEIIGIRQVLAGWDCNTPWSQTIALSRAIETAVLRKNGIEVAE